MWTIIGTQDDASAFDEHIRAVLAQERHPLPPLQQRIGHVDVRWEQVGRKSAFIQVDGGSHDDRLLARAVVAEQLRGHGYRQATWSFDEFRKTADWNDIMAKAKRLIQSGNVKLLRNGYNNVVGWVKGDHGEYEPEIYRDDPNSRAITGSFCTCLLPGTLITLFDGSVKPVEEIREGDRVLTGAGVEGTVAHAWSRPYRGTVYGMRVEGATETVWMTDTHRLPDPDGALKEARDWSAGDYSYLPEPHYVPVTEINVGQYVSGLVEHESWLHKPNKLFGRRHGRKPHAQPRFSRSQKPIPAKIPWDNDFAWLSGLFVAEGMTTPGGELRWTLNARTEQAVADEVIRILGRYGLQATKRDAAHNNTVTVAVQSRPMATLFAALFGQGAKTKRLHLDVMSMPTAALDRFFAGWFEGDGHNGQQSRDMLATASPHLAMQARLILARLGRESVIRRKDNNVSPLVPGGTSIYTLAWRHHGGKGHGVRYHEGGRVHQRMVEPETREYAGPVYNFEVQPDHTYVISPGIASANCDWGEFQNQPRTRQWKKFQDRPCAHILALYWTSLATPLDEDTNPAAPQGQPQAPPGGATFPQGEGFGPDGGAAPPPGGPDLGDAGTPPMGQAAPMPMAQPGGPPAGAQDAVGPSPTDVLPQFPMEGLAQGQIQPASIPGGRGPSPTSPIAYPAGPGGAFSSVHTGDEAFTGSLPLSNGDLVQLRYDDTGTLVGRSEEHGAGRETVLKAGQVGEVLGTDPTTGMVNVLYMGSPWDQNGPLEPYGATGWHFPSYLVPRTDQRKPGPAIRRR